MRIAERMLVNALMIPIGRGFAIYLGANGKLFRRLASR
jgi:hypothetical protein